MSGYQYEAVFNNSSGNVTTTPATLIVQTQQPPDLSADSPLTDGSLLLAAASAGLNYVSGAATGQVLLSVDTTLSPTDGSGSRLSDVTASATMGGLSNSVNYGDTVYLAGSPSAGVSYRFVVPINASTLATGRYAFTMNVLEQYADGTSQTLSFVSYKDVLNWSQSPFGPGWNLEGLDALAPATAGGPAGVSLVESDGTMTFFWPNGSGEYNAEAGPFAFDTLTGSWTSGFTLTGTNGTLEDFNTAGQLTTVTDGDGNNTVYNYPGGLLTSINAPGNQTTSFGYTGSLVTSITDFAGRITTLGYSGGQLTSITEPTPNNGNVSGETSPEAQFGYTSGKLTSMEDPNSNTTTYAYDPVTGALSMVTYADQTTCEYQAALTLPLDNGACLTPTLALAAANADESGDVTTCTLDRFGNPVTVTDALGNETSYTYNADEQVTEVQQPAVSNGGAMTTPTTNYTYDPSTGVLTGETDPDGSTQSWNITSYITYGGTDVVPTEYTNGVGDETVYTYNTSTGDLLQSEQYLNGTTSDNLGQNTAVGGDPITSCVYTTEGAGNDPTGAPTASS